MKVDLKNLEVTSFVTTLPREQIFGGAAAAGGAVGVGVVLRDETIPPYCPQQSGDDTCR